MSYKIAKGVFDILPKDPDNEGKWRESHLWLYVESVARQIAEDYGFRQIRTPIFEKTELFQRSIGSTTDIVTKEMYTFLDKANRSLTLRPEGTAPVMRAFIEKRLDLQSFSHKFFYLQPMFRYERQQAGRYRQHHQFGVEAIGNASPLQDVEIIHLFYNFLLRLGIKDLTLHVNSIGESEERSAYREALKIYLQPHLSELSDESKERFLTNPLRILDSKNEKDKRILEKAPALINYLSSSSRAHFEEVLSLLEEASIPYSLNSNLVRGLDYYNKTVFEVTAKELGAQNSIGGGGRYDGLIAELGGPTLPAMGFGAGLERIIQTLIGQKISIPNPPFPLIFLIPIGETAIRHCFSLLCQLRNAHIPSEMEMGGKKLKNALRMADAAQSRYVLVLGEEELTSGNAKLKNMKTGIEEILQLEFLIDRLKQEVINGKLLPHA